MERAARVPSRLANRAIEVAFTEPLGPGGAPLHMPQVRERGIPLLDADERQVTPQGGVIDGLRLDRQLLELERHGLEVRVAGRGRGDVALRAPGRKTTPILRIESFERLDPARVQAISFAAIIDSRDTGLERGKGNALAAPHDDRVTLSGSDRRVRYARGCTRGHPRRSAGLAARDEARRGRMSGTTCRAADPTKSRNSGCGRFGRLFSSG